MQYYEFVILFLVKFDVVCYRYNHIQILCILRYTIKNIQNLAIDF